MTQPVNEEPRLLLRRIVESLAWRQIASMNILGHCLKYITDIGNKLRVASELDLYLRLFEDVRTLYGELGWEDIESAVRDRLDDVPYPQSRLEFGVAYFVIGQAERVAMNSYTGCNDPRFAAIAMSYVDAAARRPRPTRFIEFAQDPTNRPQAQQFLNRWIVVAVGSFGRHVNAKVDRPVELGLRTRSSAEMYQDFVDALAPLLAECGLSMPNLEDYGLESAAG